MASGDFSKTAVNSSLSHDPGHSLLSSRTRWIDITVPIFNGLVCWPGDPPVSVVSIKDMEKGASNNLSKMHMGAHTGTHIDAPRHFIRNGKSVTSMSLDQMIGVARVIEIHDSNYITPEELAEHNIRKGERILFKTRNSLRTWHKDPFNRNFVSVSRAGADFLSQKTLKAVGIDYLSVGAFNGDGAYVHRMLLGSGIWLIEGIDLSAVSPGRYYLICLPLKLESVEGAPARAILKIVS